MPKGVKGKKFVECMKNEPIMTKIKRMLRVAILSKFTIVPAVLTPE